MFIGIKLVYLANQNKDMVGNLTEVTELNCTKIAFFC